MPRWLHVGMSIKRWLVLLVVGITLLSLSAGYFLHALYSLDVRFPYWVGVLTLQFLGREVRGSLFLVSGALLTTLALLRLNRTVISALLPRGQARVIDLLDRRGLGFHRGTMTGATLHLLGALREYGKMGVTCVGDSPEEAEERYREVRAAIAPA